MIQNILKLEPNKISTDLTSYNFLLYAPPGIGKTTFATLMFPERSLILGFEYGFKGIPKAERIYKMTISQKENAKNEKYLIECFNYIKWLDNHIKNFLNEN